LQQQTLLRILASFFAVLLLYGLFLPRYYIEGADVELTVAILMSAAVGCIGNEMFAAPRTPQSFMPNETTVGVRGWLLVLCFALTCVFPASVLYDIFSHTIPTLINPHVSLRTVVLFSVYFAIFIPLVVSSFLAGMKLWLVKPGAVSFAKRFFLVNLGAHIGYFVFWVFWMFIVRPTRPASFTEMGRDYIVKLMLAVALWYFYLKYSKRVRTTYQSGLYPTNLAAYVIPKA
jgi:hypothetical protein